MNHACRFIGPEDWTDMAWRNGGGTTSEICAEMRDGTLLWRLSTAIVDRDGPYSVFPGLTRISTVIEGQGTRIAKAGTDDWHEIAPLVPTRIDGNRPIDGRLVNGPVRYLNLFFDPARLGGQVSVIRLNGSVRSENAPSAIFCVAGRCAIATSPRFSINAKTLARDIAAKTLLTGDATLLSVVLYPT
ncbi:HutD family protein [Mameliella sp.]|uniref:HutD/Ves family protein n=1 Tax=Mameliella sp. TaxID=1924940 RepID=UPI003B510E39